MLRKRMKRKGIKRKKGEKRRPPFPKVSQSLVVLLFFVGETQQKSSLEWETLNDTLDNIIFPIFSELRHFSLVNCPWQETYRKNENLSLLEWMAFTNTPDNIILGIFLSTASFLCCNMSL